MTRREKMLAAVVGLLVVVWVLSEGIDRYRRTLDQNRSDLAAVQQRLNTARMEATQGRFARRQLAKWQQQSLPSDHDIALSAYQDWLRETLVAAGLEVKRLNYRDSLIGKSQHYHQLSLSVDASGKLAQFTEFLYQFYRSPHLHRISTARFSPGEGKKLTIFLVVDALSLADCERSEKLAEGTSDLDVQLREQVKKTINSRNVFAVYQPPTPPKVVKTLKNSERPPVEARVTGMSRGEAGWQMSVLLAETGKVLVFREGDTIEIGNFSGTIDQLDSRRAVVVTESDRLQIFLGQLLSEARPLSDSSS